MYIGIHRLKENTKWKSIIQYTMYAPLHRALTISCNTDNYEIVLSPYCSLRNENGEGKYNEQLMA